MLQISSLLWISEYLSFVTAFNETRELGGIPSRTRCGCSFHGNSFPKLTEELEAEGFALSWNIALSATWEKITFLASKPHQEVVSHTSTLPCGNEIPVQMHLFPFSSDTTIWVSKPQWLIDCEELSLKNSHRQVESLWVRISNQGNCGVCYRPPN